MSLRPVLNALESDRWFTDVDRVPHPLADASLEFVPCDAGGGLFIPSEDLVMREYIKSRGTWEPDIAAFVLRVMRSGRGVFIDVGANFGYFSALVASRYPQVSVHAFEPHPRVVPVLRLNAWRAGGRTKVWPLALTSGEKSVVLETTEHNLGDTRARRPESAQAVSSMVAAATSFDELLPEGVVDVVKVDVQGAEHDVIRGMLGVLRRSPGALVVLEFNPVLLWDAGLQPLEVLGLYRQMGFVTNHLDGGSLVQRPDVDLLRLAQRGGRESQLNLVLTQGAS